MGVTIVADSGCDLTKQDAAGYGIEIVPLYVVFDDQRLRDGIDIDRVQFAQRVASGEVPKTEPATPEDFEAAFSRIVNAGNDVVAITLSSQISKSFEHANAAAALFGPKVSVFDSRAAGGLESLLAIYAAERAKAGDSASAIVENLQRVSEKTAAYFAVPDLTALGRSGRLPKAVVALGSMLNVSLVLKINEQGAIAPAGQSRSYEKTRELMVEALVRTIEHSPGAWVAIAHAGDVQTAHSVSQMVATKLGHKPVREFIFETTLTIIANLGTDGVGIFAIVP
ncbi:MAG: DegV family protein [Candidatus Eremiobacteraeota bacterium]|nr:DegV family protein [Candidatus Eremiobacteraeota bacterium]